MLPPRPGTQTAWGGDPGVPCRTHLLTPGALSVENPLGLPRTIPRLAHSQRARVGCLAETGGLERRGGAPHQRGLRGSDLQAQMSLFWARHRQSQPDCPPRVPRRGFLLPQIPSPCRVQLSQEGPPRLLTFFLGCTAAPHSAPNCTFFFFFFLQVCIPVDLCSDLASEPTAGLHIKSHIADIIINQELTETGEKENN